MSRSFGSCRKLCPIVVVLLLACLTALPGETQESVASDPGATHLFQEAVRLEEEGDLDKALETYRLVAKQFPESSFAPRSVLRRGWGLFHKLDNDGSLQAAQEVIEKYSGSRHAAGGHVLTAEIRAREAQDRSGLEEARTEFRRVALLFPRETYPRLPVRAEARVRAGEISRLLGELPIAAAAFLSAIEDEPLSEWTIRADLGLANVFLAQGDWLAAAEVFQRVLLSATPEGRFDHEVKEEARRRLTLIHRLILRPSSGRASWGSARVISLKDELRKPVAVAAHDDGRLAIVDRKSNTLVWLTAEGTEDGRIPIEDPGRPWWARERRDDLTGELYLAETRRVVWLPGQSAQTFEIPSRDKQEAVKGLEAGQQGLFGQFFLLQRSSDRVLAFDAQGNFLDTVTDDDPIDLTRDEQGRLYVLSKTGTVQRFSPEGSPDEAVFRESWDNAVALEVDPLGRVYILERGQKRVRVYDSEGGLVTTVGPSLTDGIELRKPEDLAIDGRGRLFIADEGLKGVVVLE